MKDFILAETIDMTDYQAKIDKMSNEQLEKERASLRKKMQVNYLSLQNNHTFVTLEADISECPDEKNRIYTRVKVKRVTKFISGLLGTYVENFSGYWDWINKKFMDTTLVPDYAYAKLQGKKVTFADKLSVKGLVAYKRYLLLLYRNMTDKNMDLEIAVAAALCEEKVIDKDFDRKKFYNSDFLPSNLIGIYKNLLREKMLNEKFKEYKTAAEVKYEKNN